MSSDKEIYEALQAVNALLDETGEQLLVDLVEKIRTGLRKEAESPTVYLKGGPVEATLKRWIDFDAAERLQCVGCLTGVGSHSRESGVCRREPTADGYLPYGSGYMPGGLHGKIL